MGHKSNAVMLIDRTVVALTNLLGDMDRPLWLVVAILIGTVALVSISTFLRLRQRPSKPNVKKRSRTKNKQKPRRKVRTRLPNRPRENKRRRRS